LEATVSGKNLVEGAASRLHQNPDFSGSSFCLAGVFERIPCGQQ
jgi:hypothetical protein